MRMQSVWTHKAAICVPATLATLEMVTHVWTLMSAKVILVMRMQFVRTITGAFPVSVTQDLKGMGFHVLVSISNGSHQPVSFMLPLQTLMNAPMDSITAQPTVLVLTDLVATSVLASLGTKTREWDMNVLVS